MIIYKTTTQENQRKTLANHALTKPGISDKLKASIRTQKNTYNQLDISKYYQ
ncbi:hypothetical protein [Pedobacter gandavensis]|uniref:Uncharacterized protein n=1 Tax=Pedobacter gandavensis TaxID=2679963 RepID=A0ABR6EZU8_9SPHI|nr:hypothetical protein [Pedobacter gandavensis]MBB2150344.1 hypothetical protein [Pedobacter gandavensis]